MMRTYRIILIFILAFSVFACSRTPRYQTPLDTLKAYTIAIKKKDIATMKLLLSAATMQMHQQQAQQQNVTVDDIIQRETLFNPEQTSLKYRNEKIEGDKATIEVENSFGVWDTVPFVLEEGIWKIDKQGFANQMRQDIEQKNNQTIDDFINQGRIDPDNPAEPGTTNPIISPDPNATPDLNTGSDPTNTPDSGQIPEPSVTP
jgi:hypothetical protein